MHRAVAPCCNRALYNAYFFKHMVPHNMYKHTERRVRAMVYIHGICPIPKAHASLPYTPIHRT